MFTQALSIFAVLLTSAATLVCNLTLHPTPVAAQTQSHERFGTIPKPTSTPTPEVIIGQPPAAEALHAALPGELKRMRQTIERLEARVDQLEIELRAIRASDRSGSAATPMVIPSPATMQAQPATDHSRTTDRETLDFWRGTTVNVMLDGYYGYNFNRPVGRVNLLRAYDVTSNSFSLKQAAVVIERAPDVEAGRRFGARLDLQYGQATETVQGNAASEPRPQAYRNVWQAYGTYVFPVGSGLTVDFGKFAGSLGYETNYTKDNFNYSRAYFFNFLPFYHFGFRTTCNVSEKLTVTHWLVNGAQQSEDFNGFKSQHVGLTFRPSARLTLQTNYYTGQEQRDVSPSLNPTFAPLPTQPGLSTDVIRPTPDGRFHVLDAYATWNATDRLTLALEGDYVINRAYKESAPTRVWGGAGYARYQVTPQFALAGRFEYLADRGGLFSGVTQDLKEHTLTAEYKIADGFVGRMEYRRDYSNRPFFLTNAPGVLKKEQNTATLGLVWWFGRKQGTW